MGRDKIAIYATLFLLYRACFQTLKVFSASFGEREQMIIGSCVSAFHFRKFTVKQLVFHIDKCYLNLEYASEVDTFFVCSTLCHSN